MKHIAIILGLLLCQFYLLGQKEVPQQIMQQIYEEVKTPYKYGMIVFLMGEVMKHGWQKVKTF